MLPVPLQNVIKWMFSYWPCNRSKGSHIGMKIAVLALGFTLGQYSHPKADTTGQGPVTGPMWKHLFHDIFINQLCAVFKVSLTCVLLYNIGLVNTIKNWPSWTPSVIIPQILVTFSISPHIKPRPKSYRNHAKHCIGMMQAVWHIFEQ